MREGPPVGRGEGVRTAMRPLARSTGLVVRQLPDEVVVYDKDSHQAHCLNRTAAAVFLHADGQRTLSEIAAHIGPGAGHDTVRAALDQLAAAGLLESAPAEPVGSRREVLRQVGLGAAVLAPIVASLLVPTPAEAAATCIPSSSCTDQNIGQPCYLSNPATECSLRSCQGAGVCTP